MAGEADRRSLYGEVREAMRPPVQRRGPLTSPPDLGTLNLGDLTSGVRPPLAPYSHKPKTPTATSIGRDWQEADAFARSHVGYSPQGKKAEPRTQAAHGAAENLLRDLYLQKKTQVAVGTAAERMFAKRGLDDVRRTSILIGPSPQNLIDGRGVEHGAITDVFKPTGSQIYINPDHPEVAENARSYGLIAGLNYAPLHELGHAVPGFRHARYGDPVVERQTNSDGGVFADQIGAPYPSDFQLRGRGSTLPAWPFGRR